MKIFQHPIVEGIIYSRLKLRWWSSLRAGKREVFLLCFASHKHHYLDFSPFSRSLYVVVIYASKQQRLSFSRKIVASLVRLNGLFASYSSESLQLLDKGLLQFSSIDRHNLSGTFLKSNEQYLLKE